MRRSAVLLLSIVLVAQLVAAPAAGQSAEYSGEIQLTGSQAADGSEFNYELGNNPDISEFNVSLTGAINEQSTTVSGSGLSDGDQLSLDVGGTLDPIGPSTNGEPTATLTGSVGNEVFYSDENQNLKYIDNSGSINDLGVDAATIGGIGDINDDGDPEAVYESFDSIYYVDIDGNTTYIGGNPYDVSAVGDVNADGDTEVIYRDTGDNLKYIDSDGNSQDVGKQTSVVGGIGDIDDDGDIDIIYQDTNGNMKYTDSTGNSADTGVNGEPGGVGDINDDGDLEIAYSISSSIYYTDGHGNTVNTGAAGYGAGGIGDIDGDGNNEIAYATTNRNLKYADSDGKIGDIGGTAVSLSGEEVSSVADIDGDQTTDPAVDIDGDGTDEASVSGTLAGSQTVEIPSLDLSDDTATVSTSNGQLDVDIQFTERTETRDPTVSINGNDAGVSGTLADGTTQNLTVSESWIESGQNNVSISTNNPTNGPGSVVGFDYSHLTTGPSESISINATEWEEIINASKTYPDAQQNVDATITFADDVISVAEIEISRNGGAWQTPSSWSMTNQTLVVDVGDVNSGDEIAVRAEGRRVDVVNGGIEILEPTTQGNTLDTKIRINAPAADFGIDTSGTSDRIHYGAAESWDSSEYVEVDSAGNQIIRMPNVADGSTTRIRRAPLSMSSSGDPVTVRIDDPDTPAWTVTDQGATPDNIQIDYLDPAPLSQYEIYSLNEERSLRTAEEDGGVASFTADGRTGSYEIRESASTAGAAVAVAGGDDGSSSPLSIVALLAGLGGSLVGALVLGRRLGVGSTRTRIGIGLLLGTVGIELATARSIIGDLILGIQQSIDSLSTAAFGGGAGTVVLGILILISLVIIRRRIGLPDWLLVSGGLLVGVFVVDEISGGLLTGALDELGPLVWILLLIGGGVLLYRVLAPRPINIGGDG